jgi:hypothetical protein
LFKFTGREITDVKVSISNAVVYICNIMDRVIERERRDRIKLVLLMALEHRGVRVPTFCLVGSGVKTDILETPA